MSINTLITVFVLFFLFSIKFTIAMQEDVPFWKPNCQSDKILFLQIHFLNLSSNNFSVGEVCIFCRLKAAVELVQRVKLLKVGNDLLIDTL